ncbi:MAG TPA: creatininase family protein [Stellaceae bacterium]|nr:creatininase family protein [Stellaceae bacterium]
MRVAEMNWMQIEARVALDDRCILPIGSTEQHAYLSLATDSILAERVAADAAGDVPVFPVLPFGLASMFLAYPGTIALRLSTFAALIEDMLDSVHRHGFRRIMVVNGHGGNAPVAAVFAEWMDRHRDARVRLHDWWRAPRTWAKVMAIDPAASHASWMENFPWTRLPGIAMPATAKPEVPREAFATADPTRLRHAVGDGNYHGLYQRDDAEMLAIWEVAVAETRDLLENGWSSA